MLGDFEKAFKAVTKDWTDAKRRGDRQERIRDRDWERLRRRRPPRTSIKEAAFEVMEQAYLKASANGTLPANARQVMYAARPLVLDRTGGRCWKDTDSSYFTQHLLPDYIEENAVSWDVVFDARGHLAEPHSGQSLGLGTAEVGNYLHGWQDQLKDDRDLPLFRYEAVTSGPAHRYGAALFIEKEGFGPLLERAQIANRFDLAIMSTKGISVTAARQLVERLSDAGVTVYVLHDFDKAGLVIASTLARDTRRYTFAGTPDVVDLGLRLADVQAMGLASEPVYYQQQVDPRFNLRENGATEAECDFLVQQGGYRGWNGQRVELNAMASDQFIDWLEKKLKKHRVGKVIPDEATLDAAYRRAYRMAAVNRAIEKLSDGGKVAIPKSLVNKIRTAIKGTARSWDSAIWEMASAAHEAAAEDDGDGRRSRRRPPRRR